MRRALAFVLAAVGCGKELHHTTDAMPVDAPVDVGVSTDDPPSGAVTLTVTRGSERVPNVTVFFQDPSSTLIDQKLTNEHGLAWALMPGGGFVTAIEHRGNGIDEITTFAGVAQADALELAFVDPGQTKQWPLQLAFPADPAAMTYQVHTSCSSDVVSMQPTPATATDNIMLLAGCDDGVADFAIESFGTSGVPTGNVLYVAAVGLPAPPAPLPTDAMPPVYPVLTLSGAYAAVETHTLDYTNVSDDLGFVLAYQGISATRRAFSATASAPRTSLSVSAQVKLPAGAGTQLTVTTGVPVADTATRKQVSQPFVYTWDTESTAYALNLAASTLAAYDTAPVYSASARTISWTERGSGLTPDLVRARFHAYRDDVPAGRSWGWRIVAARSGTTITYPQLPVLDFDFNPKDGDAISVDELTNVKLPGGFDAWRATGFADLMQSIRGASGQVSAQALYAPEL